jgi:hypothetical protein
MAGMVWLTFALLFEAAVGFELSPAITVSLGLVVTAMAGQFALAEGMTGWRRLVLGLSATVMVFASAIAVALPPGV